MTFHVKGKRKNVCLTRLFKFDMRTGGDMFVN